MCEYQFSVASVPDVLHIKISIIIILWSCSSLSHYVATY
jgi:hypothetical protein